ncbi:MAG: hypothetical protein OEX16_01685 [Hadesarchaea archaeon]|nr:hypothetical protein [Hadesarchaea archaeon]
MRRKYENSEDRMPPPESASRIAVSIVVGVGWLIFLILFLAFYAGGFNIWQNLAIMFVSLLVVGAILGPMWAYWGIKTGQAPQKKTRRRRVRRTRK